MAWLLWTSNHLVSEATTYTAHNRHERRTSMPSARFEPAVPATEQPQTYEHRHRHDRLLPSTTTVPDHLFIAAASCNSPVSTCLRIKLRSHPVPESGCPLWYTECVTCLCNIWGNRHFIMDRGCMLSVVSTPTNITGIPVAFWRPRIAVAGRTLAVLSCCGFLQSLRLYSGILS